MKHKVSELSGGLLDAAVALARGNQVKIEEGRAYILVPYDDGSQINSGRTEWIYFGPSGLWKDGGPIIDKYDIQLGGYGTSRYAEIRDEDAPWVPMWGETSLIAAMRAFVVSRLGEEVELP